MKIAPIFLIGLCYLFCRLDSAAQEKTERKVVILRKAPALQGQPLKQAKQLLRVMEFGHATGVFYLSSKNWRTDLKPDAVGMQSPQPQAEIPHGSVVALWTFAKAGDAQKMLAMPDCRGKTLAEAEAVLKEANLGLMIFEDDRRPSAKKETLIVTDQFPPPEQMVYEKTSVLLRWSAK